MDIQTPCSHTHDPASSYDAEQRINKSGRRKFHQDIVYSWLTRYPESTAAELHEHYLASCLRNSRTPELDLVEFRRRLSDMKGLRVDRRKELRICRIAGKRVSVWYVK